MTKNFREGNSLYCKGACCLCGKSKGSLTPGTVRHVDGFSDCPVEFCQDCVKGMALAESDERKKELGSTFVGRFIDVESGTIVLKDLSGLREKMAQSLQKSIEEGLRFNPLAGSYSDLIKIDVDSCHFQIEKGAFTANAYASSYARDVIAFSRGLLRGGAQKCPACGTDVRCLTWKEASFGASSSSEDPERHFGCAFGCIDMHLTTELVQKIWHNEILPRQGWISSVRSSPSSGIGAVKASWRGALGKNEDILFMLGLHMGRAMKTVSSMSELLHEKFLERGGKADYRKLDELADELYKRAERMDKMEMPDGSKFDFHEFKYRMLKMW